MTVNFQPSNVHLPGYVRGVVFALGIGILGVGSFSCAKAQAKSAPDGPPLDVPSPPARMLAPVEEPVIAEEPVPEPPPTAAAPPRTPPRPVARRPDPTPPEPVPAVVVPEPVPVEPRELRAASPARDAAAEKDVRDRLARAARDLGRVDYGKLSADARTQYDQSKRFTLQAEQAIKDRNFVFAATLADKAATLAAELVGR